MKVQKQSGGVLDRPTVCEAEGELSTSASSPTCSWSTQVERKIQEPCLSTKKKVAFIESYSKVNTQKFVLICCCNYEQVAIVLIHVYVQVVISKRVHQHMHVCCCLI